MPKLTRKFNTDKKTTTVEGYRDYKRLQMREKRQIERNLINYVNEAVNDFNRNTGVYEQIKSWHGPKHLDNWEIGSYETKPLVILTEHLGTVLRCDIENFKFSSVEQAKELMLKLAGELENITLSPTVLYQVKAMRNIAVIIADLSEKSRSVSCYSELLIADWLKKLYVVVDTGSCYHSGDERTARSKAIISYKLLRNIPLTEVEKQDLEYEKQKKEPSNE